MRLSAAAAASVLQGLQKLPLPANLTPRAKSIALVGYGAIGSQVGQSLLSGTLPGLSLVGVYDPYIDQPYIDLNTPQNAENIDQNTPPDQKQAQAQAQKQVQVAYAKSLGELIQLSPDIVVEAAGHSALKECIQPVLSSGIDLLIVSVGALSDEALYSELLGAAAGGAGRFMISTGAIGGIDILGAAKMAGDLEEVSLRSTKPVGNLLDADIPEEKLAAITSGNQPVEVFSGSAREAAQLFPKSANVCATVGLATVGLDKTKATIIADPHRNPNQKQKQAQVTHQIYLRGDAGEYELTFNNKVSAINSKTSAVVPFAVLRALSVWGYLAGKTSDAGKTSESMPVFL